ncbi:MAG: cation-translocating P-type ATPase [Planctomycetota bacterium]
MSELVLPPSAASPGPLEPAADEAASTRQVANRLVLTCCGGALLFNGFVAGETGLYAPEVAALSSMAGALILAAPILVRAARNLWDGRLQLDELIALGVAAAIAFADYLTAGAVAFFALLGELVEKRTALGARAAIEGLVRLTPTTAQLVGPDGVEVEVTAQDLRPGQTIRVRPGESVPADGVIARGRSTLEEASITGESLPAEKGPGAEVFAGTLNVTGAIDVEVSRAGADTTLGQVKDLILAAEASRTPVARLIDRYVAYYLPLVIMLAFVIFFFSGDQGSFVAALVVACPTALVLATPTAMVAALSCAARLGILIKDARDIEVASRLTSVMFDKTGTLTTGELNVVSLVPADERDPADVLRLAAAVASRSTHPASKAVVQVAAKAELQVPEPGDTEELPGLGVVGSVDGVAVVLGRRSLLAERGVALPADDAAEEEALSRLYVGLDGRLAGVLGLEDGVRPEAKQAISKLRTLGVKQVSLMTGDRWEVARQVGVELAVDDVAAECLPGEKLDLARAARTRGERVAVVGDGVNDAPALAAGDLGIAMGAAGADVAIGSARVALMNNDLRRVPFLIELSRSSRAVVTQNLLVAAGLVVGGLALAGAGALRPVHAILLHNLGSLFVVFNSARLIRLGEDLA